MLSEFQKWLSQVQENKYRTNRLDEHCEVVAAERGWKEALKWVLSKKKINNHPGPNTGGIYYYIDDWDIGRIERELGGE